MVMILVTLLILLTVELLELLLVVLLDYLIHEFLIRVVGINQGIHHEVVVVHIMTTLLFIIDLILNFFLFFVVDFLIFQII
jgi:hypothetical protein